MGLFGTDGVRGVANVELSPELALALGRAAVSLRDERNRALIGRDTRRSGEMLSSALAAGLASVGIEVLDAGIIPTPAIPFLVQRYDASFGVVISASHNPPEDNGIKFFDRAGFKISEELEAKLDQAIDDGIPIRPSGREIGRIRPVPEAAQLYLERLIALARERLGGSKLRLVVDCASGATSGIAAKLFSQLGLEAIIIHDQPDGDNINLACGSTDLRSLQEAVRLYRADLGVAYDGDGDRALFVDAEGREVDGDAILLISALAMHRAGALSPPRVVATVMSNLGLEEHLRAEGIELVRTSVGDRYVAAEIEKWGCSLGGEQSGHIIFRDCSTTGDGLITTVQVLSILERTGRPLAELAGQFRRYPQVQHNIPVRNPGIFHENKRLEEAIASYRARLDGVGRLVVRPSGTQPLIRVMVEGKDERLIRQVGQELSRLIEQELNHP
ncbi:MAG: phosphoglucosamine mutase [Candidatus Acetothermia bacterium]|nr:phosphoglucosamine mutase [Candidatus Acetothermia bacterium]MDH7505188.1 phosphoglucosamine mutase [Candidatus Acetothermia bacterium]